ncbi:uncharacterized protein Z520_03866 [Fonsecaea multimorphosa CBS 102226]|uniref:FAD-dependent oxidoreductase 2 FAD-binding domain-containing protein n=1 Tax=Fonsecaea multimorphosa CBS 102226 TaxID=1442371 RepID=A0A0D2HE64_9EURO|nr:uncharacterized protein Z520_03866 [Fonsecaea multimorphosa CBS 102226]KIY00181.1 hypothetical protein Z520_03866 [Fonsecaea multimorphosa CBS 102226]OAL27377.1 hypothetical protein AYO22_03652 [Fonsecaea multimorphosa]
MAGLQHAENAQRFDVIVVGGGNAALCAALSAHDQGARVLILEAASREDRGGNSRFAGSVFRAVHNGLDQVVENLLCDEAKPEAKYCYMHPYTPEMYHEDLAATSHGRNDPAISEVLVQNSWDTLVWMKSKGVKWELILRQFYDFESIKRKKEGTVAIDAGGPVQAVNNGVGLMDFLWTAAEKLVSDGSMTLWYDSPAHELLVSGDTIRGVQVRHRDTFTNVYGQVILASGGFSANPAMRRQYLGEGWDLVLVRGTKYNTGTMLRRAIEAGARPVGHWGACHSSPQDADGPLMGDINISPLIARYSYMYGISVNTRGERFMDEGEDHVSKTYAKTGKKISEQPEGRVYQIFDQQTLHILPKHRYNTARPVIADTIPQLAVKLGIDAATLQKTVDDFNAACPVDSSCFEPMENDGLCTKGLAIPKSNWALRIEKGPFKAYATMPGITFTYGGIATDASTQVLNNEGKVMPGLFAVGEITGGLFYHNYPGGAGLPKGAVFGRIAGREAANAAARTLPTAGRL